MSGSTCALMSAFGESSRNSDGGLLQSDGGAEEGDQRGTDDITRG